MIAGLRKIFAVQNPDEHKKMATIIDLMNLMFDPVRRFQRNFLIDLRLNSLQCPVYEMVKDCMAILEVRRYVTVVALCLVTS